MVEHIPTAPGESWEDGRRDEIASTRTILSKLMRDHPTCRDADCGRCAEKLELFDTLRRLDAAR